MPAVFECADRLGVSKRVSSITVPLGVTLNRDGSALFIVLVCFFFAQMANVVLNVGQIVLLTCVAACLTCSEQTRSVPGRDGGPSSP